MKGRVINRPQFFEKLKHFLNQNTRSFSAWTLTALLTVLGGVSSPGAFAEDAVHDAPVAVLFDFKKPFVEAVEGLSNVLEKAGVEPDVFTFDDYPGKKQAVLKEKMLQKSFQCYIGVGPQAARFLWTAIDRPDSVVLYTMVLNPEKILPSDRPLCGISLNIPIQTQVREIAASLPSAMRIGLLFDPRYNGLFFSQSKQAAEGAGRAIIPLKVSSSKEIPAVLERQLKEVDALWMIPDPTVISESVIQYIIKRALMYRVPVIGYNTFFYESGASLNFIFDYGKLGEQTGELVLDLLRGGACRRSDPIFSKWINLKVVQKLGIVLGQEVQPKEGTEP